MPTQIYPLFEIALRAHERLSPSDHARKIARLSASLAAIAAPNPHAWFRDGKSAEAIGTVTAANRMIAYPYPKFMTSILDVDQAAAVIVTTAGEARALGIAPDRWVYLHGGGEAHDIWHLKDRVDFCSSPGMTSAFRQALDQAGVTAGDVSILDVYSCFPAAVQFAARLLGTPSDGTVPLSVTGGLPYFGGPGNSYALHAIATMVERLRERPADVGLVSGLGWYMTKHAVGVYAARPPERPWARVDGAAAQAAIDGLSRPRFVATASGPASVETYTVLHDRDGAPVEGIVVLHTEDGARTLATIGPDPDLLTCFEREEMVGSRGVIRPGPTGNNVFRPAGA